MRKYISIGLYSILFVVTVAVLIYNGNPYANYAFCAASLIVGIDTLLLLTKMEKLTSRIFAIAGTALAALNTVLVVFTSFIPEHIKLQLYVKLVIFILLSLVIYNLDSFDFKKKSK